MPVSFNSAMGSLGDLGSRLSTRIRMAGRSIGTGVGLGVLVRRAASPSGTIVTVVGPPGITNAYGEVWTITAGAQIAVNGIVDSVTNSVIKLAYANGLLWQLNTSGNWYSKPRASAPWSAPTRVSPLSSLPEHAFSTAFSTPPFAT